MTQLRVFQDLNRRVWVEVTSPKATMTRSLFVRAFFRDAVPGIPLKPSEIVIAELDRKPLLVAYLLISSKHRETCAKLKLPGLLDENSFRDVLNNILDILGYD